jgi:hypothetical protein
MDKYRPQDIVEEKLREYMRHVEDNRAHLSDHYAELPQSTWEWMHEWDDTKIFQKWEMTTGQAAEETGVCASTIAKWCEEGRIRGAYRGEKPRWWHLPIASIDEINRLAMMDLATIENVVKRTKRYWVRWYTEKGQNNGHDKGE